VFNLGERGDLLLLWSSRAFLVGLAGHAINEVVVRSFYAQQDARTPFYAALLNLALYTASGILFFQLASPPAIALSDSLVFTSQAVVLLILLNRKKGIAIRFGSSLPRAVLAAAAGGLVFFAFSVLLTDRLPNMVVAVGGMAFGVAAALPFVWREARLLLHL
jgi:putative peptidoglycan lipid II flippase